MNQNRTLKRNELLQKMQELETKVQHLLEKDQVTVRYVYDYLELKVRYRKLQEEKEKMEIELLERIFTLGQRIKTLESQL